MPDDTSPAQMNNAITDIIQFQCCAPDDAELKGEYNIYS